MKKKYINTLKEKIKEGGDPIKILENSFKGKKVLVVSGGPSASKWKEVYDKENNKNLYIVCIKQTIDIVEDLCDFHFINTAHLQRYQNNENTMTIMTKNGKYDYTFGQYDINFQMMSSLIGREQFYLAKNLNFESYTLNSTGEYRPSGPGIMYETVIYTLVHMGFEKIITIGWDIADDNGTTNRHYYESIDNNAILQSQKIKIKIKLFKDYLKRKGLFTYFKIFKFYTFGFLLAFVQYQLGKRINSGGLFNGEAELVSNSLPKLNTWLELKNIELKVVSDSKWMDIIKKSKDC